MSETHSMRVYGLEAVQPMLDSDGYLFKLVAHDSAVCFFPHTTEHRDVKQADLSYEDDSKGNALAAMVKPGRIEFRFHRDFSDEHVRNIGHRILGHPDTQFTREFAVIYQGRTLISGTGTV